MDRSRYLVNAVRSVLAVMIVELIVSLLAHWPHQFGGHGDPHHMIQQFVSNGTALAPPLVLMIALAVVGLVAGRDDRWGLAGAVLMIPIGALLVMGSVGEFLAAASPDVPRAVQLGIGPLDVALSALLLVLAVWDVTRRLRGGNVVSVNQA